MAEGMNTHQWTFCVCTGKGTKENDWCLPSSLKQGDDVKYTAFRLITLLLQPMLSALRGTLIPTEFRLSVYS